MANIKFSVKNQTITRTDDFRVVKDSQGYLYATFIFTTDEWNGLIKTAEFRNGKSGTPYSVLLDDTGSCLVPHEVLSGSDSFVYVSVFAGNLITVNVERFHIEASGYWEGAVPSVDPTPSVYTQIINRLEDVETTVIESAGRAAESEENARGYAQNASESAQSANTSEINAKNSENSAKQSEQSAYAHMNNASESETNAYRYKNDASVSATSAYDSQLTATQKANEASQNAAKVELIYNQQQGVIEQISGDLERAEAAVNSIEEITIESNTTWSNGTLTFTAIPRWIYGNVGN